MKENGQQEFQTQTGINIETDIDHVIAAFVPTGEQNWPHARIPHRAGARPVRPGEESNPHAGTRRAGGRLQGFAAGSWRRAGG
jgi:hypothetical protein